MSNTSYLNKREHSTVLVRFLTVLSLTVMVFFSGTVYTGKQLPAGTASAYHAGVASTASIPVCSTLMFAFNLYHILNVK